MNIQIYIIDDLLILIPVLYIIGMILKRIQLISNRFIPLILLGMGISISIGLIGFSLDTIIQGILVTGAAVFTNQLYKQSINCNDNKK